MNIETGSDPPINFGLKQTGPARANGSLASGLGLREDDKRAADDEDAEKVCRICLEDEEDVENGNPFIVPCKCIGSLKYIHLKCLREWTDSKR